MPDNGSKPWYLSKTIWIDILFIISLIWQSYNGFIMKPEEQAAIILLVNLVLRVFTGKELTK